MSKNHQYRGNISESSEFEVRIKEEGEYRILFSFDDYHGKYGIEWTLEDNE